MSADENTHCCGDELVELTVTLEEDQVAVLKELAEEYKAKLNQDWDLSGVLRVAVGAYLTQVGRIT